MVRFTEILCPVDGSNASAHALDHALALARSYKAHLTVMEASWARLPPIAYPGTGMTETPPLLLPRQLDELREELRQFARRWSMADVNVDLVVREGAVVPVILEEAQSIRADVIVLGTHGRSGFDRFLLGSVTEKIIRKAECAVMTVPPADRTSEPARAARTIVCGVDFSPASLKAVDHALSLAQELPATLLLTHVIDWHVDRPLPPEVALETAAYRGRVEAYNQVKLQALVPDDARTWCQAEEVVAAGRPHEEIVRLARERDADLIVLGVHGRSAMNLALFGSTTNQVVRHATCPVLTVRG
jgi:nucleotide-binding universal stress UspA family protein